MPAVQTRKTGGKQKRLLVGHGAVFGSATNTLLAPIAITGAVFGFQYMPLFAFVCAVAFYCNGNHSIYRLQRAATRW